MRICDCSSDVCPSDLTEGGHVSFPPRPPEQIAILERLSAKFGRVSNERLVCGPGLVNIHRALSEIAGVDHGPLQPADITAGAAAGDPRRLRATDAFSAVFGDIARALVLTTGAWDGVYLTRAGFPRIPSPLQTSSLPHRLQPKGPCSRKME